MTYNELFSKSEVRRTEWPKLRMTPDELYDKICSSFEGDAEKALLAVVELHKPIVYAQTQLRCPICVWSDAWDSELYSYPCPTIEAIQKELV